MKKTIYVTQCIALLIIAALAVSACGQRGPANTVFSAEDASGKIIGVLAGTSALPYASALGEAVVYPTSTQLMDALKTGALDCAIMEKLPGDKLARRTSGVKALSAPLLDYDLCFAIAKENADLMRDVNAALRSLGDSGALTGLYDKHMKGGKYNYSPPSSAPAPEGTLTLAVPGEYPPYVYINADGEYDGLDIDVARAVCSILGVELKIMEEDMTKLVTAVQLGRADLALGGVHSNEEEAGLVDFSISYAQLIQVILVRT